MTAESFSSASDRQRRTVRIMMEVAGCPKCPHVRITYGRNCNEFGCPILSTCERMIATQKAAELLSSQIKQEKNP